MPTENGLVQIAERRRPYRSPVASCRFEPPFEAKP
jgi:hypothetical protein